MPDAFSQSKNMPPPATSSLAAAAQFFSSPAFAVVGASSDPAKYGYKVLKWYTTHSLPVIPINPSRPTIQLSASHSLATVPSVSALPAPTTTALSIITPPAVTRSVLDEAASAGVTAVWMQPGAFDAEVERIAREKFAVVLAGFEGGTEGDEGWCVLVDGERALEGARREGMGDREGKL